VQIKIPMLFVRAWDSACDLLNVQIYVNKWFELRLIDVLIGCGFVFCVVWYGAQLGLNGAVAAGVMFIALAALALFMRL
jgi:hypothetical protein